MPKSENPYLTPADYETPEAMIKAFAEPNQYDWRIGMGEVSGFGKPDEKTGKIDPRGFDYERCCQLGIRFGCEWLDEHPSALLSFKGFKDVFGIIESNSPDAKELSKFVSQKIEDTLGENLGLSDGQHQAIMMALLYIKGEGWEKYCESMSMMEAQGL